MPAQAPSAIQHLPWRDLALVPREDLAPAGKIRELLLNPDVTSPRGYVPGDMEPAQLRESRGGIAVCSDALGTLRLPEHGLAGRDLSAVRRARYVDVSRTIATPAAMARVIGHLALAGVPMLTTSTLPALVQGQLGASVSHCITTTRASDLRTDDAREATSVVLRRRGLRSLTSLGVRTRRSAVTVIAEVADLAGAEDVLASTANQDHPPAEVVLLVPTSTVLGELFLGHHPHVRVVVGEGDAALARTATAVNGQVAEMAPGLAYSPHHLSDLLLAQAFAHEPVTGVELARRYVRDLDIVAITAQGSERPSNRLHRGTTVAPASAWLDGPPSTGYATHALGVAAVARDGALSWLDGTQTQLPGWAETLAAIDGPVGTQRPPWARSGPRPIGLMSYFA